MASHSPKRLDTTALYDYAVSALARRSLTAHELRRRLARRAAHASDVDQVIDRLREVGYLDDAAVAEAYSRFRRDYEGLGRQRILRELSRRGVERPLAEKAVEEVYRDADELELIRGRLRRKLGAHREAAPLDDRRRLASLFRSLIRAGFPSAKIVKALQEISSDTEWLETLADQHPSEDEEAFD